MDDSLAAEVLALRSLLRTWIGATLAHSEAWESYLKAMEGYAQSLVASDQILGVDGETQTLIRETASARVSQMISTLAADIRAEDERRK